MSKRRDNIERVKALKWEKKAGKKKSAKKKEYKEKDKTEKEIVMKGEE